MERGEQGELTRPAMSRPPHFALLDAASEAWMAAGDAARWAAAGAELGAGSSYLWRAAPGGARWFVRTADPAAPWRPVVGDARHDVRSHGARGDGHVDDAPAIRAALAAGAGGVVVFPEGDYRLDLREPLRIGAGTTLSFHAGARLALAAEARLPADSHMLEALAGADDVTVLGMTLAGGGRALARRLRGLVAHRAARLRLEGCSVRDFTGSGLVISDCPDAQLLRCEVVDCGRSGDPRTAEAGVSLNADVAAGDPYWPRGTVADGGRISGSGLNGIVVSTPRTRIRGLDASGNGVDAEAAGIYFTTHATASQTGLVIEDCRCRDNSGNGIDTGPNAPCGTRVAYRDVRIARCECIGNGAAGVQLDDVEDVVVEDCRCVGNGRSPTTGQRGGIVLASQGSVRAVVLRRNRCSADGAAGQRWGVQAGVLPGASADAVVLEDNDLSGNAMAAMGGPEPAPVARLLEGAARWRGNRGHAAEASALDRDGRLPASADLLHVRVGGTVRGVATGSAGDRLLIVFHAPGTRLVSGSGWRLARDGEVATGSHLHLVHDGTQWRELSRLET